MEGGGGRVGTGHIIRKNIIAVLMDLYRSLIGMDGGFVKSLPIFNRIEMLNSLHSVPL